ncbi:MULTISPECIES: hypothetical protein [unclassified Streptomyces]|uniref:hypothetical protein n=1 Tax=unclassified Streptomyces TaxID=2593676 RepID=UPI003251D711
MTAAPVAPVAPVGAEATEAEFWVWEVGDPVRCADAVDRLHRDGTTTWLELGPSDVLVRMVRECLPGAFTLSTALDRPLLGAAADVA